MVQTQKQKEWYLANKEKMRQYQKEWYQRHKKEHDEKSRKWAKDHPEETAEYLEKSYNKRRDKMQEEFKEKYYGENSEEFKEHRRQLSRERKHTLKAKFLLELGAKCSICGKEYDGENGSVFDFHHLNPEEKEWNPSKLFSKSEDKIREEIQKCTIVCANCHRLIHNSKY